MMNTISSLTNKHPFFAQLVRFGFVGCTAAAINFAVVSVLVALTRMDPLLANAFGFLVAFQISFHGHKRWTFSYENKALPAMTKFLVIAIGSFALNESLFAFFLKDAHLYYQTALLLVLVIVPPITFTCSKLWAFKA